MTAPALHLRKALLVAPALLALGLAAAAAGAWPSLRAPAASVWETVRQAAGLSVQHVEIEGRRNLSEAALARALGDIAGADIAALDIAALDITALDITALRMRLESLGWIASAEVTRHLPGTLAIALEERAPFALWQRDGRLALIDRGGVRITMEDLAPWHHLPLLVGREAPQAAPRLLAALANAEMVAQQVQAAVRVSGRRWDLRMRNGILLRLPADDRGDGSIGLEAALAQMAALERRHRLLGRDIAVVDFRLSDRLVVRLTPDGRALSVEEEQQT